MTSRLDHNYWMARALALARRGDIHDAKTLVGLLYYRTFLKDGK